MTNINKTPHTHPRADTETRMDSGTGMRRDAAGNPQHDTNPSAGGMGRSASFDVSGCETIGSLVHDLLERIDEIQQGKRDSVPTGFRDIDSAIQGLWPGQLALIAGRPGMGESVLGLDFARSAALRHHMATVVFSSTMSSAARDADVVFLIHRPEAHDPWHRPDTADIIMAKNNNGPTTTCHLGLRDTTSKFIDLPPHLHETPLTATPIYAKRDET